MSYQDLTALLRRYGSTTAVLSRVDTPLGPRYRVTLASPQGVRTGNGRTLLEAIYQADGVLDVGGFND